MDVKKGRVENPVPLRVHTDQTVGQLKESLSVLLKTSVGDLCCVVEKSFSILHRLTNDHARLYAESIGKGSKVIQAKCYSVLFQKTLKDNLNLTIFDSLLHMIDFTYCDSNEGEANLHL